MEKNEQRTAGLQAELEHVRSVEANRSAGLQAELEQACFTNSLTLAKSSKPISNAPDSNNPEWTGTASVAKFELASSYLCDYDCKCQNWGYFDSM